MYYIEEKMENALSLSLEDQNRISSSFAFDQAKEMAVPYAKESGENGEDLTEYLMLTGF